MPRRTPEEVWQHLVDEAGEDEIEHAARVSGEEAATDLATAGFDVAAEREKAGAFLHSPEAESARERVDPSPGADERAPQSGARVLEPSQPVAAVEQVAPSRIGAHGHGRRRRPVILWLAAAAAVSGGASALLYAALHATPAPPPPAVPPPTPAPAPSVTTDLVAADGLRRRATAACDANQWRVCLEHLDEARKLDPAGDDAPSVQMARDRATRHMQDKPSFGPPQAP